MMPAAGLKLLALCAGLSIAPVRAMRASNSLGLDVESRANASAGFRPGDATLSNKCKGSDTSGCLICDEEVSLGKYKYGYTLVPNEGKKTKYTLTAQDGSSAQVKLPILNSLQAISEASLRNCFALATHQSYLTPGEHPTLVSENGNSPVHMPDEVTEENFQRAMELEEAIFLGRTDEQLKQMTLKDKVVEGRVYYLVAALIESGAEYHFWGLWNNGWYCVLSLVNADLSDLGYQSSVSKLCPRAGVFTQMISKGKKYNPDMGGFYLFPCRGEGSSGLDGDNKC